MTAISISESSRVRGINLENDIYHTNKGKSEVFFIHIFHTDVPITKGTELGCFLVCKMLEAINNQEQRCGENEQTAHVFPLKNHYKARRTLGKTSLPRVAQIL